MIYSRLLFQVTGNPRGRKQHKENHWNETTIFNQFRLNVLVGTFLWRFYFLKKSTKELPSSLHSKEEFPIHCFEQTLMSDFEMLVRADKCTFLVFSVWMKSLAVRDSLFFGGWGGFCLHSHHRHHPLDHCCANNIIRISLFFLVVSWFLLSKDAGDKHMRRAFFHRTNGKCCRKRETFFFLPLDNVSSLRKSAWIRHFWKVLLFSEISGFALFDSLRKVGNVKEKSFSFVYNIDLFFILVNQHIKNILVDWHHLILSCDCGSNNILSQFYPIQITIYLHYAHFRQNRTA